MEHPLSDYEIIRALTELKEDLSREKKGLPFLNITGGDVFHRNQSGRIKGHP